jgi:hypothetical protein
MSSSQRLVALAAILLFASGCARSSSEVPPPAAVAGPVLHGSGPEPPPCETILGEGTGSGAIAAKHLALASLGRKLDRRRGEMAAHGSRSLRTLWRGVRCKPYSVVLTNGRLYKCSAGAEVCPSAPGAVTPSADRSYWPLRFSRLSL